MPTVMPTLRSSINLPVLIKTWSEVFQKASTKRPGLDIWKKSLLNDQHYLFFKF